MTSSVICQLVNLSFIILLNFNVGRMHYLLSVINPHYHEDSYFSYLVLHLHSHHQTVNILKPFPSSVPVNGVAKVPIGSNPSMGAATGLSHVEVMLASMSFFSS